MRMGAGLKTITFNNGVRLIVKDDLIPILIAQFNRLSLSANVAGTTEADLNKVNYTNRPCLVSDFNNLQRQDKLLDKFCKIS